MPVDIHPKSHSVSELGLEPFQKFLCIPELPEASKSFWHARIRSRAFPTLLVVHPPRGTLAHEHAHTYTHTRAHRRFRPPSVKIMLFLHHALKCQNLSLCITRMVASAPRQHAHQLDVDERPAASALHSLPFQYHVHAADFLCCPFCSRFCRGHMHQCCT